jgi:hypothetical protein
MKDFDDIDKLNLSSSFNEGFKLYINDAYTKQQKGSTSEWFSKYVKKHKPVVQQDITMPNIVHKLPSNASQLRRAQAMRKSPNKKHSPTRLLLEGDSNSSHPPNWGGGLLEGGGSPLSPTSAGGGLSGCSPKGKGGPVVLSPLPVPPSADLMNIDMNNLFDEEERKAGLKQLFRLDPLESVLDKKFPTFHLQRVQPELYSDTWKRNILCEYCMFPVGGNCIQCMYCPVVAHYECSGLAQANGDREISPRTELDTSHHPHTPFENEVDLWGLEWVCPECISDIDHNHNHNAQLQWNKQLFQNRWKAVVCVQTYVRRFQSRRNYRLAEWGATRFGAIMRGRQTRRAFTKKLSAERIPFRIKVLGASGLQRGEPFVALSLCEVEDEDSQIFYYQTSTSRGANPNWNKDFIVPGVEADTMVALTVLSEEDKEKGVFRFMGQALLPVADMQLWFRSTSEPFTFQLRGMQV